MHRPSRVWEETSGNLLGNGRLRQLACAFGYLFGGPVSLAGCWWDRGVDNLGRTFISVFSLFVFSLFVFSFSSFHICSCRVIEFPSHHRYIEKYTPDTNMCHRMACPWRQILIQLNNRRKFFNFEGPISGRNGARSYYCG